MWEYWEWFSMGFAQNFDKIFALLIFSIIVTAAVMDFIDKNYPPGPLGVPFFGYLPFMNSRAPHLTLTELAQQYGRIYSLNLGSLYTVVVSDVKMIRDAFADDVFSLRPPLFLTHGLMGGKGLIGANGESWKETRAFVSNTMKDLVYGKGDARNAAEPRIQTATRELVQDLKNHAGQPIQMDEVVRHHVGNTLSDFILGTKFEKDSPSWKYLQLVLQERFRTFTLSNSFNYIPWLRRFSKYANILNVLKDSKNRSQKIYTDLLETSNQNSVNSNNVRSVVDAYSLELKRRAKNNGVFSSENIEHVLSDLVNAGWDTTSATLNWLYLYMALYPRIQDRVSQEIDAVVGNGKEIALTHLDNMPYTRAVILEIWRHRTILPMGVPHATTERKKIGEYWIPKGAMIMPLLYAAHHDALVWSNPEEFRPERHLNDDGSLCSTENLLTFQAGKRACVGEALGRQIVQLFFANTVSQLKIGVPKGSTLSIEDVPDCGATLTPRPYQLRFELRK
ncbi:unnamed protein product [Allacma fusca]|uniref:Cytochrome P450 n=1 Tax=Allacma fusca TaxID=39272 RepID=A0A8J2LTV1_9HEXA|nr:unnamed protein product [Allacma fusca]